MGVLTALFLCSFSGAVAQDAFYTKTDWSVANGKYYLSGTSSDGVHWFERSLSIFFPVDLPDAGANSKKGIVEIVFTTALDPYFVGDSIRELPLDKTFLNRMVLHRDGERPLGLKLLPPTSTANGIPYKEMNGRELILGKDALTNNFPQVPKKIKQQIVAILEKEYVGEGYRKFLSSIRENAVYQSLKTFGTYVGTADDFSLGTSRSATYDNKTYFEYFSNRLNKMLEDETIHGAHFLASITGDFVDNRFSGESFGLANKTGYFLSQILAGSDGEMGQVISSVHENRYSREVAVRLGALLDPKYLGSEFSELTAARSTVSSLFVEPKDFFQRLIQAGMPRVDLCQKTVSKD